MAQLPAYFVRNQLLDLAPIDSALDSYQGQQNRNVQYQAQEKRFAADERRRTIEQVGNLAAAADGATDPRQRAIMLRRALELHPDYASGKLDPVYLDPATGPKLLAAEAGKARDALADEERKLGIAAKRQALSQGAQEGPLRLDLLRAQTAQAQQRDELGAAKAAILRGMMPSLGVPGAGSAPTPPRLQQQSYGGGQTNVPGVVVDDPNFIRTQASPPPGDAAPARPPGVFDNLTPGQKAGVALGMIGMGDAGKIVADADPRRLGKEAGNENDKRQLNATEVAARLSSIEREFEPAFQTYDKWFKMQGINLADSFEATRNLINPKEAAEFEKYTVFRQNAVNNLSEYIKMVTGAAMGVEEEKRIRKGIPDPEKDGPRSFAAKLKNSIRETKLAIARYNFLRKEGFAGDVEQAAKAFPLERINRIINDRAGAILRETQNENPGIAPEQLRPLVRQKLRSEFGIDA